MEHTDFFRQYQYRKQEADRLFESVNEALFGLIGKKKSGQQATSADTTSNQSKAQDEPDDSQENDETQAAGDTKDNQAKAEPTSYKIIKNKKGGFYFGDEKRFVAKINDPIPAVYDNFDFSKSPLKILFDPSIEFQGDSISFDTDEGVIYSFISSAGYWKGTFIGKEFDSKWLQKSEKDYFKGKFYSKNSNFSAPPVAFADGKFIDKTKSGILGSPNIINASEANNFSLIQVPAGYSIEILTNKQLRYTISTIKRLDNIDSNFIFSVSSGTDMGSSPVNITIPWNDIRINYNNYQINPKIKGIPKLFQFQNGEKMLELKIVKTGEEPIFKKKVAFNPKKEYMEDTSKIPGLNSLLGRRYTLGVKPNNDQEFDLITKAKAYAGSPQFIQDLDAVSVFLDNEIIDSSDIKNYPFLKNVLTSDVISEVDFRKKSEYSNFTLKNPYTNDFIKNQSDIVLYLQKKYEDYYNKHKQYPKEYNKEFADLYDNIVLKKVSTPKKTNINWPNKPQQPQQSQHTPQVQQKESDGALRRLEGFVKNFVYKIEMGESTNQWRKFILDTIKNRIQRHKTQEQPEEKQIEQPTKQQPQSSAQQKAINIIPISESFIRLEIRKILSRFL